MHRQVSVILGATALGATKLRGRAAKAAKAAKGARERSKRRAEQPAREVESEVATVAERSSLAAPDEAQAEVQVAATPTNAVYGAQRITSSSSMVAVDETQAAAEGVI